MGHRVPMNCPAAAYLAPIRICWDRPIRSVRIVSPRTFLELRKTFPQMTSDRRQQGLARGQRDEQLQNRRNLAQIRSRRGDRLSPSTLLEATPRKFWPEFAPEAPVAARKI